jgi:hypothetical protein
MTANYIASIVQCQYEKLNIDEISAEFKGIKKYEYGRLSDEWVNKQIENKQYHRWIHSCYLLETYLERNFETFVETELVYHWAKQICEKRNKYLNKKRIGWV